MNRALRKDHTTNIRLKHDPDSCANLTHTLPAALECYLVAPAFRRAPLAAHRACWTAVSGEADAFVVVVTEFPRVFVRLQEPEWQRVGT